MMLDNFTVFDSFLVSVLNMAIIFVLLSVFYFLTGLLPGIAKFIESKAGK